MSDNQRIFDADSDFIDPDGDEIFKPNFISNHDGTSRGTINPELSKDFKNLDEGNLPYEDPPQPSSEIWNRVNTELEGLGIIQRPREPQVINPRSSLDHIISYLPHPQNIFKSSFGSFWVWILGGIVSFIFVFFPAYWWGTSKQMDKKEKSTTDECIKNLRYKALPPLPDPKK